VKVFLPISLLPVASVLTLSYLKSEAARAKRGDFEAFLEAVPNMPVEIDTDKIGR
jgi:hypothetical protein